MSDNNQNRILIRKLRKGDIFSFDEIYHKHNRKIFAYSLSYLKSKEDAEGVVQEVFMNLWRKCADLNEEQDLNSYLFAITFNAIRKRFRKLERERKYIKNYAKTLNNIGDETTDTDVEYNNLLELTKKAINKLPPRQKTIYLLSNEEGLTNEEISKRLKISKKTVENHLHRAKTYLKQVIQDERLITLLFCWMFIQ